MAAGHGVRPDLRAAGEGGIAHRHPQALSSGTRSCRNSSQRIGPYRFSGQVSTPERKARAVPLFEKDFPGGLYTLDADGFVIHPYASLFPEMPDITGYKAGCKSYFTTCRDTLAPCTADSFTSADRREEILVVAVPRLDEAGRFIGILDAVIDLSTAPFSKMANAVATTGLALDVDTRPQLYLLDQREIVLAPTRHDHVGKSFAGYDDIAYLLSEDKPDPQLARFGAVAYVEGTPYHTACFWEAARNHARP